MPVTHLTDVVVSRLKTPGTYYDESTPAFAIRVGKNRKTWVVIRGRERERTNIGKYPQLGLADARKEAAIVARQMSAGDAQVLTLTSAERESFVHAKRMLIPLGIPLHDALREYVAARAILKDEPLIQLT